MSVGEIVLPKTVGNRDVDFFQYAKTYLTGILAGGRRFSKEQAVAAIELHLRTPQANRPDDLRAVYRRYLESAKNYQSMPNIFRGDLPGGLESIGVLTGGFDPHATAGALAGVGPGEPIPAARLNALAVGLIQRAIREFGLNPQANQDPMGRWHIYFRSLLTGAAYLSRFDNAQAFYAHIDRFYTDPATRIEIPGLLARHFVGVKDALVADWLKELGFLEIGKPDVHIKDIFNALGLAAGDDPYTLQGAMQRVAAANAVTAFAVDKVFWLCATGNFHHGVGAEPDVQIGNCKDAFIRTCRCNFPNYGYPYFAPTPAPGAQRRRRT